MTGRQDKKRDGSGCKKGVLTACADQLIYPDFPLLTTTPDFPLLYTHTSLRCNGLLTGVKEARICAVQRLSVQQSNCRLHNPIVVHLCVDESPKSLQLERGLLHRIVDGLEDCGVDPTRRHSRLKWQLIDVEGCLIRRDGRDINISAMCWIICSRIFVPA